VDPTGQGQRRLTILAGETQRLVIALADDAIRRKRP
jgi:hypothetical protein